MKRHYLLYPINDIKRRLISFLPSFLICLAGLYITCSMLFMQYGAYQADLYTAEQKYHICLPNVPYEDIEEIEKLTYVQSVDFSKYEGTYTVYIWLKNSEPYRLKAQCEQIIKDIGLDKVPAYANNIYYKEHGIQDNWINGEYYELGTAFFYGEILFLIFPLLFLTAIGFYLSILLKIKNQIDEYATLRTFGIKISQIVKMIVFQYSIVFIAATLLSVLASIFTLKAVSNYTIAEFTDEFLLIAYKIPIKETVITILLAYVLFLLLIQSCRKILKQNICLMLNKTQEYTVSYSNRMKKTFFHRQGIDAYNRIYFVRSLRHLLNRAIKNIVLFILPFIFVALSASVYSMRGQAETFDHDYGIFYNDPYEVTDEIVHLVTASNLIDNVEMIHPYDDGTYGGIYIYCKDGKEEEAHAFIENISKANSLLFTDNYHAAILIEKQSEVFSAFYLLQAGILFFAAIIISLSDTYYHCQKRTKELAIIRSMGLDGKRMIRLYYPDLLMAFFSFLFSVVFSFFIWNRYFGFPYIKPVYILCVIFCFSAIYLLGHICLYVVHRKKMVTGALSKKMKEIM